MGPPWIVALFLAQQVGWIWYVARLRADRDRLAAENAEHRAWRASDAAVLADVLTKAKALRRG